MSDGARQGLDIHTIMEGIGREGMAHGVERHVLALGSLKDSGESFSACRWISRHVLFFYGRWEQSYRIYRLPILREHFEHRRREDDASFRSLSLGWLDL